MQLEENNHQQGDVMQNRVDSVPIAARPECFIPRMSQHFAIHHLICLWLHLIKHLT